MINDSWDYFSENGSPKESEMEFPIFRFLLACNGRAEIDEVYKHIYKKFEARWTEEDHKIICKNETRWHNRIRHAVRSFTQRGYVRCASGSWIVTDKGWDYASDYD